MCMKSYIRSITEYLRYQHYLYLMQMLLVASLIMAPKMYRENNIL